MTPITEEQAVTATEKVGENPCFFICGINSEPIPAASAVDEPDMPEPARQMTDQRPGQLHQTVGDAGRIHDIGSHQKKRHGQQHEGIVGLEHLVHQQKRGQPIIEHKNRDAGQAKGKGYRDAQNHQNDKDGKQDCCYETRCHGLSLRHNLILSTNFSIRNRIQVNPASGQAI